MAKKETYIATIHYNQANLWSKIRPLITRLDIELTERCNNNCIHCCINLPENDSAAKQKELSTKEIKRILKETADLGALTVRFTGGEPLLRNDFNDLYLFARKLGLKVMLFTNARLINTDLIELFRKIPPLEKIEVTVYGMHEKSYEAATRIKGSFAEFWHGVNLLLEHKIPFIVKGALLPSNKHEIEEFETWANTISWMENPPQYAMFFDLHNRKDEIKNKTIKKLRLSAIDGLKILSRDKKTYLKNMQEFCSKFMRPPDDKLFSCGAGHGSGCVDAYGNLQLCLTLRASNTVYDLKNGTLKDAINNFFPLVKNILAQNNEYLKRCAKCFLKGLCEQCPAKSWAETGTLDTPVEYLCEIAHSQAEYLGLIEKDEKAWEIKNWQSKIEIK
ncbi:MAG: radical SAM protein [Candidatus Margulisiibacteriota bacterium]|jgi:radical SAM protein with 4Fe4S-binding SPASM domain